MSCSRAGDLAGCLRDPVVLVDRPSEVKDAHHQHEEDDDRQRELHERLAVLGPPVPLHGFTRTVVLPFHGTGTVLVEMTSVTGYSFDDPLPAFAYACVTVAP